jgi:hypothetical protein
MLLIGLIFAMAVAGLTVLGLTYADTLSDQHRLREMNEFLRRRFPEDGGADRVPGYQTLDLRGNKLRVCFTQEEFITYVDPVTLSNLPSDPLLPNDPGLWTGYQVEFVRILASYVAGVGGDDLELVLLVADDLAAVSGGSPFLSSLLSLEKKQCDVVSANIANVPSRSALYGGLDWLNISGPQTFTMQVFPSSVACSVASVSDLCGFTVYTDSASVSETFLLSFNSIGAPCALNNIVVISSLDSQADWVAACSGAGPFNPCFILTGANMVFYDVCDPVTGSGLGCDNVRLLLESPYPTALAFRNYTSVGVPLIDVFSEAYGAMLDDGITDPTTFAGGPLEQLWFNTVPGLPVLTFSQFLVSGCVSKSVCGGNSCTNPVCATQYFSPAVSCPTIV